MTFERIVPLLLVATVTLMAFATWVTQHRAETVPHQAAVDTHATSTPTAGQESASLGPLPTLSPLELQPASDEGRKPQPQTWTDDQIWIAGRVVNAYGDPIAGAEVHWRQVSEEAEGLPPFWVRRGPEDAALSGWNAGHTTPNPLTDGLSEPIRLGRGFQAYDVGVAHCIATVPGHRYRATIDSRYVFAQFEEECEQDHDDWAKAHRFTADFGVDPGGQTDFHRAESIAATSVLAGPANAWRRYEIDWEADADWTAVWFRAACPEQAVPLVWFDNLQVTDLTARTHYRALAPRGAAGVHDGQALTDRDGRFTIALEDEGHYLLCAQAAGYARGHAQQHLTPLTRPIDLVLPRGETLAGRVVQPPENRPVEGCVVTVYSPNETLLNGTPLVVDKQQTDADGRFAICGLASNETYGVAVEKPGYRVLQQWNIELPVEPLQFVLEPAGYTLGAQVWWDDTDEPAEGASVLVYTLFGQYVATGAAAAGNTVRVSVPEEGDYFLVPVHELACAAAAETRGATVAVRADAGEAWTDLYLERGAVLELAAVDTVTERPVPDVQLELVCQEPQEPLPMSNLSAQVNLLSGGDSLLSIGGPIDPIVDGVPPSGAVFTNGSWMPSGGMFYATTVGEAEGDWNGVVVLPLAPPTRRRDRVETSTARDGRVTVAGLVPGRWSVRVRGAGHQLHVGAAQAQGLATARDDDGPAVQITIRAGERNRLDLPVYADRVLQGRVVDAQGRPAPARLYAMGPDQDPRRPPHGGWSWTDTSGTFELALQGEGPWTVGACADEAGSVRQTVDSAEQPVVLQLEPWRRLAGTVRWRDGRPVGNQPVLLQDVDGWGTFLAMRNLPWQQGRTDADGRFTFEGLAPGVYGIVTQRPEGITATSPAIDLRGATGDETVDLVIPLAQTIALAFSHHETAEPMGRLPVVLHWRRPLADGAAHSTGQMWVEPQRHEFEAVTDEAGIAVFDNLTPGGYAIELRGDGAWQPVDPRLEVREGGEIGIDVPCRPATRSRRQRGNASSDSRTERMVDEVFLSY